MSEAARETAARSFARLLAGEIRLYNEEAVIVSVLGRHIVRMHFRASFRFSIGG